VTPIFPVRKGWQWRFPDAFWGPAVHWNTFLNCYVMLLNHAAGSPSWGQEGVYVSFNPDLSRPELWTTPQKILDRADFVDPGAYYPQVMGLEDGATDRRAGETARLYLHGVSKWEIDFIAADTPPRAVAIETSTTSAEVTMGTPVTLTATAMGAAPFAYQWLKDGRALPGQTEATLTFAAAQLEDTAGYTVLVSNPLGSAASGPFALTVTVPVVAPPPITPPATTPPATTTPPETTSPGSTPPPVVDTPPLPAAPEAFLTNLSVRAQLDASQSELTLGFALNTAAPKPLLLRAIGPTLEIFGLSPLLANPQLEVFDAAGRRFASNDNWASTEAADFAAVGAFALPEGSRDAALALSLPAGPTTARISGEGGGLVLAELYDPAPTKTSKMVNLSARAGIGRGTHALVAGFTVGGSGEKRVLIRALGPQLAAFGLSDALADPVLTIYDQGGNKLAENRSWEGALQATFSSVGAAPLPLGSRDAALVIALAAGTSYTAVVRSADATQGEALLEIFELP
jgi:hypothetical protein